MINVARMFVFKLTSRAHVLFWYSVPGIVCALILLLICCKAGRRVKGEKIKNVIRFIASNTFMIYLIHFPIARLMQAQNISGKIAQKISQAAGGVWFELLYTAVILLITFVISIIISIPVNLLVKAVSRKIKSAKQKVD